MSILPTATPREKMIELGDVAAGRPTLGLDMPVAVYRLFQYTLRDVLTDQYNARTAKRILFEVGRMAGMQFSHLSLRLDQQFEDFTRQLQQVLREQRIGVLQVETVDPHTLRMTLTVAEDLDCSGLPVTGETLCDYDEGFIAGILEAYSGRRLHVEEVDCWATGARVCRFNVRPG